MNIIKNFDNYSKASFFNVFFFSLNVITYLVMTPLLVNKLGSEIFGIWSILWAIVQFSGIANFGAGTTLTKFISQYSIFEKDRSNLGGSIIFGYLFLLITGIITTLALLLAENFIINNIKLENVSQNDFGEGYFFIALSIIPQFIQQVSKGILYGLLKNSIIGALDFFQLIILWSGLIYLSYNNLTIRFIGVWCITNISIFSIITTLISSRSIRKFSPIFKINKNLIKEIFNYSFFTWINQLGINLFQNLDKVIVGLILTPSLAGVYSIATSLALRINMLLGQITQVLIPYASRQIAENKEHKIIRTYKNIQNFSSWMLVIISSITIIWIPEILKLWISSTYSHHYSFIFTTIIVSYTIFSLHRPAHQILSGIGLVKFPAIITFISGIFMLFLLYLLTYKYGIIGSAFSNFGYCLVLLMNFYLLKKYSQHSLIDTILIILPPIIFILIAYYIVSLLEFSFGLKVLMSTFILIFFSFFYIKKIKKIVLFN